MSSYKVQNKRSIISNYPPLHLLSNCLPFMTTIDLDRPIISSRRSKKTKQRSPGRLTNLSQSQTAGAHQDLINQSLLPIDNQTNGHSHQININNERKSIMEELKTQFQKIMVLKETIQAKPSRIDQLERFWRQKLQIVERQSMQRNEVLTNKNQALELERDKLRETMEEYHQNLERQREASAAVIMTFEKSRKKQLETTIQQLNCDQQRNMEQFSNLQAMLKERDQYINLDLTKLKYSTEVEMHAELQEQLIKRGEAFDQANQQIGIVEDRQGDWLKVMEENELLKNCFQNLNSKILTLNEEVCQLKNAQAAAEAQKDQLLKKLKISQDSNQANLKQITTLLQNQNINTKNTIQSPGNRPRSVSSISNGNKTKPQNAKEYFQLMIAQSQYRMTHDELLLLHSRTVKTHQEILLKNIKLEKQLDKMHQDLQISAQTNQNTINKLIKTQKDYQQQIQTLKKQIHQKDEELIKYRNSLQLNLQQTRSQLQVQFEQSTIYAQQMRQLQHKLMIEHTQKQQLASRVQQLQSLNDHLRQKKIDEKELQTAQKQIKQLRAIINSYESKMKTIVQKPAPKTTDKHTNHTPLNQENPELLSIYIQELIQSLTKTQAEYVAMVGLFKEQQLKTACLETELSQLKMNLSDKLNELNKNQQQASQVQVQENPTKSKEGLKGM